MQQGLSAHPLDNKHNTLLDLHVSRAPILARQIQSKQNDNMGVTAATTVFLCMAAVFLTAIIAYFVQSWILQKMLAEQCVSH